MGLFDIFQAYPTTISINKDSKLTNQVKKNKDLHCSVDPEIGCPHCQTKCLASSPENLPVPPPSPPYTRPNLFHLIRRRLSPTDIEASSKMENTGSIKQEAPSLPPGIFEIPGEPAVVINGVPDEPQTDCMIAKDEPLSSSGTVGSGEWLVGRQVRKFFLGRYYSGTVIKFDKETGWYRVEYEDEDSEDLDWSELEEILLPLDVTVPLRSISLQIIKNRQIQAQAYGFMPRR